MSGNDDGADESEEAPAELSADSLDSRLDDAAEAIEAAETEPELDDVEADLDAVAEDVEAADLPEPEDEDEQSRAEQLEARLEEVRDQLEEARGPYAEDVADAIDDVATTIQGTEWTETGVEELRDDVEAYAEAVDDAVGAEIEIELRDRDWEEPKLQGARLTGITGALDDAAEAVTDAGLDADDDAETIGALLASVETFEDDVEAAEHWTDLSVRQQLDAHGYYDVLDHRKAFPPEWDALKSWEQRHRADMILLAMDKLESDFMERHCFEALRRLGPEEALDDMVDYAQKRNEDAIEVLGKIGSERPVEGLLNYVDAGDPGLRTATLKALGEIGSEDATREVANQLVAEASQVRSQAARALGMIGDTRAIEPLADVVDDREEEEEVRAAAAWALNRIGTERARQALSEYSDDRSYLVQAEAEKAV
ncbi:MAG: HEAT repeat domain-containing protein [Halobacteriales archaeon]